MNKIFTYLFFCAFLFFCSSIVYVQGVADAEQRAKGVVAIASLEGGATGGSAPEDDIPMDYEKFSLPNY